MQHSRPTFHLFSDRLANEKKRLEAQLAELQPGPERDQLLQKLRQLDTASHINSGVAAQLHRVAQWVAPIRESPR